MTVIVLSCRETKSGLVGCRCSETTRLYVWPGATPAGPSVRNVFARLKLRVVEAQSMKEPTETVYVPTVNEQSRNASVVSVLPGSTWPTAAAGVVQAVA